MAGLGQVGVEFAWPEGHPREIKRVDVEYQVRGHGRSPPLGGRECTVGRPGNSSISPFPRPECGYFGAILPNSRGSAVRFPG
ncbi:MAG: hypothetical protein ACK56F_05945, partial [bacterium]